MLTATRAGGCAPTTVAFAAVTFPVSTTADALLVVRRRAVVTIHHRGSTGVVMRFALTVRVVCSQCRRCARQQQKQSGQKDESVDG
jgi:hypothetical protein